MTHRPSVVAVPVLVGSLVVGGCTFGGQDDAVDAGTDAPAGAAPEPSGVGDTVEVLLAAAGEESVDLSGELPVLATRPAASGDGTYEVDLNGVAVQDELMTVVFTVRVLENTGIIFSPGRLFDDGRGVEGDGGESTFTTDGVYVLDPASGTRHLVAYDSEGLCVCSTALNGSGLDTGGSVTLSSTFAAPPEGTTTVDVVIPTVGAFTGVTLER